MTRGLATMLAVLLTVTPLLLWPGAVIAVAAVLTIERVTS